jgi:hypothetical protein
MIKASEFMRQGRDDAFKRAVITRPARLLSKRWITPGFIECPVCTGVNGFAVAHAGKACEPGHPMLKPRRIEFSFIAVDECVAPLQRSISESIAAQDAEDAAAKAPKP